MRVLTIACCMFAAFPAAAAEYVVSPDESTITYTVKTFGLFRNSGAFGAFDIHLKVDEQHPDQNFLLANIDMTTATMSGAGATARVRSPAWFDIDEYPVSEFRAAGVPPLEDAAADIRGEYTLRGKTEPLLLAVETNAPERDADGEIRAIRIRAHGAIDRKKYGLNGMKGLVGRMVEISIDARLVRKEGDGDGN
ncbi:MAG: YceI family protein [Parvularculaceae bacterium]